MMWKAAGILLLGLLLSGCDRPGEPARMGTGLESPSAAVVAEKPTPAQVAPPPRVKRGARQPKLSELLERAGERLAKQLAPKIPAGKAVAVLPFADSDGGVRRLGVLLQQSVERQLVGAGATLVDRDNLDKLLDEVDLRLASGEHGESLQEAERIAKAGVVVLGKMMHLEEEMLVSARALRVGGGTSRILAATEQLSLDAGRMGKLLWYVNRPSGIEATGELPPLSLRYAFVSPTPLGEIYVRNGSTVRSGQRFKIRITPNSDCYLYVLLYDSQGKVNVVFPHHKIRMSNRARGGVTYRIPEETNWYWFDENPGDETFYLVASYVPLTRLESILATLGREPQRHDELATAARQEMDTVLTRGMKSKTASDFQPKGFTITERGINIDGIDQSMPPVSAPTGNRRSGLAASGHATTVCRIKLEHR